LQLATIATPVFEKSSDSLSSVDQRIGIHSDSRLRQPLSINPFNVNIENVVASANLHQNIDLESVAKTFPAARYKPDQFPGLIHHLRKPDVSVLVFRTGKLVIAGAKSEARARRAVLRLVEELKASGLVILGKPDITITNIVASADLRHPVDLEDIARNLQGTIYEPDQFPGLIYRSKDLKEVILIFASGKLVCTGATSEDNVPRAIKRLYDELVDQRLIITDPRDQL